MVKKDLKNFKDELLRNQTVGLDTMCFIYQFANHETFSPLTNTIFESLENNNITAVTSTVSILETLIKPEAKSNPLVAAEYEGVFREIPNLEVLVLDWDVARTAAKLRAKYPAIRTPDAVQIAAAILGNANTFITNDNKLSQVEELKVLQLNSFVS